MSYNGSLAAGASTVWGFLGSCTGTNTAPDGHLRRSLIKACGAPGRTGAPQRSLPAARKPATMTGCPKDRQS